MVTGIPADTPARGVSECPIVGCQCIHQVGSYGASMGRHRILVLVVAALVAGLCLWVVAAVFELPLTDVLVVAGVAALLFFGALLPRWAREAGQHEAEARREQHHRRPHSRRRT